MKNYFKIIALTAILTVVGCSNTKLYESWSAEKKMNRANKFYEKGKFSKAAELYELVVFERNLSETAFAQMRLANCYFNDKKYLEARIEYQELIKLFPDYDEIATAQYRIGLCYMYDSLDPHYTQEETVLAIEAFETFLERFPSDTRRTEVFEYLKEMNYKLLTARYYRGYIYYRMQDFSSALLYLNEIIELGNHDELEENSLYYKSKIYLYRKDAQAVLRSLERMKGYFPDSKKTRKIEKEYNKLLKKLES